MTKWTEKKQIELRKIVQSLKRIEPVQKEDPVASIPVKSVGRPVTLDFQEQAKNLSEQAKTALVETSRNRLEQV